jgi:outer membrane protein
MGLRASLLLGGSIGLTVVLAAGGVMAQPRTLQDALAAAYANNPSLQAARAQLRSVDEGVPAALAGWRPQISITGSFGYAIGEERQFSNATAFSPATAIYSNQNRRLNSGQATITQQLYRGGRTRAGTNQAENKVMAQRASLIASEEQVFSDTANAFVTVIQNQELLQLDINNEQVLAKQLQATNDRFRVGEITRTDVAQAEAALAGATATRQTAEGNLATARSNYQRLVGELPDRLIEPQPLKLPAKNVQEGRAIAAANNPNVIAALFNDSAAKDNFDLQYSALMPNVSIQGTASRNDNTQQNNLRTNSAQVLANLTVPIYQGGAEYAAIRQARQLEQQARKTVDDARRTAINQFVTAWETYQAAKATIESTRAQIRSNEIALEGVQREAIVGSRTTLDVLNAEQTLLNSRVTLVQNLASFVTASYSVAAAAGRLTARDLNLNVPLYDETAYYNAVRDRWIGTGDYATEQPGR